ncbi:hypothetical protein A6A06_24720 [Streptomyces sp. CB02923]|uniref:hypothetical protein n=1 Tax=Streptomyces sp. CB02923 TaxID=1718985 RepID=UPI00095EC131|nr:hypothetical protein [Streptomyces sp. CB02923]OKI00326.1 hypothetical protein A6A06_24720 [Streptomyces sp. CB02923]
MELTDVVVAKVAAEYGLDTEGSCDALDVELLVMAGRSAGLLAGVVLHPLVPADARDESFVVAVCMDPKVAAVSFPVHVREVIPPHRTSVPRALRYTLGRIGQIADQVVAEHARWSGRVAEPR